MGKNKYKKQVLLSLLPNGIAMLNGIKTISNQRENIKKCVTNCMKNGLITNASFTIKIGYRKHSVTYKKITKKGVQWLIDNYSDEIGYLAHLPNPMPKFNIQQTKNNDTLYRLLKSISASIMFSSLNIPTMDSTIRYDSKSKNPNLVNLMQDAKAQDKTYSCNLDFSNGNSVYLHNKDIFSQLPITEKEIQQYNFTSQIGFLLNSLNSYVVYATSPKGLIIKPDATTRLKRSVTRYINISNLPITNTYINQAIIFCKNAKEFTTMFIQNCKYGISDAERYLSNSYQHIYAIPITRDGVFMLDDMLAYSKNLTEEIIDRLLKHDSTIIRNTHALYPVKHMNSETYIGLDMDIVKLQRMYFDIMSETERPISEINSSSDKKTVICYEWQKDYYNRIFKNKVNYYTVPDEFMGND